MVCGAGGGVYLSWSRGNKLVWYARLLFKQCSEVFTFNQVASEENGKTESLLLPIVSPYSTQLDLHSWRWHVAITPQVPLLRTCTTCAKKSLCCCFGTRGQHVSWLRSLEDEWSRFAAWDWSTHLEIFLPLTGLSASGMLSLQRARLYTGQVTVIKLQKWNFNTRNHLTVNIKAGIAFFGKYHSVLEVEIAEAIWPIGWIFQLYWSQINVIGWLFCDCLCTQLFISHPRVNRQML